MASGYSRSPKLIKGALIRFSNAMLVPIPNIIVFQYNPETLTRSFTMSDSTSKGPADEKDELAQPYDPQESFTLKLQLDAAEVTRGLKAPHPASLPPKRRQRNRQDRQGLLHVYARAEGRARIGESGQQR